MTERLTDERVAHVKRQVEGWQYGDSVFLLSADVDSLVEEVQERRSVENEEVSP